MITKKIGLFLLFFLTTIVLIGQNIESKIDDLLKSKISDDGPGLSVIITKKGETFYHKAFGKANIELGIDMKPGNVFRIGSITKQFTACAILKLAEENKLSLADNIHKYLPKYPTQRKDITIEHLLTHTSGIKSYTGLPEWTKEIRKKDFEPLDLINEFKRKKLDFKPGEKFKYNNSGYFILGYIIEKASGISYEAYIEDNFFKLLGMENSYYGSASDIISNRASGYQENNEQLQNASYLSMTQPYSAGSLLSTVEDLSIWNRAVFDLKVINEESMKKAHTPFLLNNGEPTRYGYGWFIGERFEKPTIEHGGGINGFTTSGIYFPDEEIFIAAFSNCTCLNPTGLAGKIAALVFDIKIERQEIKLTEKELNKFVGEYELVPGFNITVTVEDGKLMIQATGQVKSQVFPESETKFFSKIVEAQIEFVVEKGKVDSFFLYQNEQKIEGKRVE